MASTLRIERPAADELRLSGRITLADGEEPWEHLHREARDAPIDTIDVSRVEHVDGAGAAWLLALRAEIALRRQQEVRITGANDDIQKLLDIYGCPSDFQCLKAAPAKLGVLDQIGRATLDLVRGFREILDYFGDFVIAVARAVRRPSSVNWSSVPYLMERAGADAVPIVLLINFLVGLIVGLQAAHQLEKFGANIFIADLVGLSMAREMGPLMTAIIVAGRSGAAYAAEIGTMRVSEEIDALRTLQLDPQRFLVLPRVLALACMAPALTLGGMLVGIVGGLVVAISSSACPPSATGTS